MSRPIVDMTEYPSDGVTVTQNNDQAGDQSVWHLHTHVTPRYTDDRKDQGLCVPQTIATASDAYRLRERLRR